MTLKDVTHGPAGLPGVVMQICTCTHVCTLYFHVCARVLMCLCAGKDRSLSKGTGPAVSDFSNSVS